MLRQKLRRAVFTVAGLLLVPVASQFFIELAREWGLYDHPSQRVESAVRALSSLVAQKWFLSLTAFFGGLAVGMSFDSLLRQGADASTLQGETWRPQGLWVGNIQIDAQNLERDFYFDLVVVGFNGTGSALSISEISGSITFDTLHMTNADKMPPVPAPRILHERTKTDGIANLQDIFVVIEQRVPGRIVQGMLTRLNGGGSIAIDLKRLNVMARRVGHPHDAARLPLWAGVTIRRAEDRLITGKIVEGHINIGSRASTAHERRELIRSWRNMLAEVAPEVRKRPQKIQDLLLARTDYLSLESHLQDNVRRLVRTGSFNHGRMIVLLSADDERMVAW